MRILFLVEMDDSMSGGLFLTTHNKIKTLLAEFQGYSADVFCLTFYDGKVLSFMKKKINRKVKERQTAQTELEGVNYVSLYLKETITGKILETFGFDSLYYRRLIKALKTSDYDLVSAHWGNPQGSMAYYIKRYKNLPYSLTLHGSDVHSLRKQWKKNLLIRNMKHADAVFFVSYQLKTEAEKIGWTDSESTSHILNNAVDRSLFYPFSEAEIQALKEKTQTHKYAVGFVGNLNKVKRADCLIELFKTIQSKMEKNITFYIIGEGPLKTSVQQGARQTDLDIRIIGKVLQKELPNYYNLMDCTVLPSRREGFGNVIGESQACGTPVIASDAGGIPEAISNPAYLVRSDEETFIEEFADKVKSILETEEKVEAKGSQWRDIVEKELSVWKNIKILSEKRVKDSEKS